MPVTAIRTVCRENGAVQLARKAAAAGRMSLPLLLRRRRTGAGVAAYFDLITDDGRLFYGDDFHFGYFPTGKETFAAAVEAHTDLVAGLAGLAPGQRVLDVGCGVGAPAIRMASRYDCQITGVNISREQVRQGRALLREQGADDRVCLEVADARALPFVEESFDAIVCLEVAGDICVTDQDKHRLVRELHRVLKPGGRIGFSDLALTAAPSPADQRVLRSLLYHAGDDLVTDWPALFAGQGFAVSDARCILAETMPTWDHTLSLHDSHAGEITRRYGPWISSRGAKQVAKIPDILSRLGTYPVLAATKAA